MHICEHWVRSTGPADPFALFDRISARPSALLHGNGDWFVFGSDPGIWVRDLSWQFQMERSGDLPPFFPDLIGWIAYEAGFALDPAFPDVSPLQHAPIRFGVFRTVQLVHRQTGITYTGTRKIPPTGPDIPVTDEPFRARKTGDTDTPDQYREKVVRIRDEIAAGNVYQANLTRREYWSYRGDDRLFARRLAMENPGAFSAYLRYPDLTVISSSPERFLRRKGDHISASPIKGTLPRHTEPETDRKLANQLLHDEKNRAELAMITDLLRNDLSRVCTPGSVAVDGFPVLMHLTNVHHLVSHVRGRLAPDVSLKQILAATFPGGSITGCPRIAAVHLLHQLETVPRGVYTGSIGWIQADGQAFDLNIAIRTCELHNGELSFGLGGGIVWDSDPVLEYDETVAKGRSIIRCLN